jgi:tetratricopeptide (TPR) repeat protein
VLDWYPLGRFGGYVHTWRDARARKVLLEKIPFLLLGGMMFATIIARLHPKGIWSVDLRDSQGDFSLFECAMQAFYIWSYYVWKPWAPFHLSPVYTTLVNFDPDAWPFWASAAFVIGTTILLLRRRHQWPWALALWMSHLVFLVPVLGVTERPHYTCDRYGYLQGVLWAVLLAAALWTLRANPRLFVATVLCGVALAVFWAGLSMRQTRVWQNSVTLFKHVIRELGDNPYRSDIQWRLGVVLAGQQKTEEAVRQFQASLRVQPSPEAYLAFGELLEKNGDRAGALTNCLAALDLGLTPPNRLKAGRLLYALGRRAEAINQYLKGLAATPDLVPSLNNLAWTLATDADPTIRNGAEAVQLAKRACALTDYQVPVLIGTLAAAYAEVGRFKDAIETAQKARDLAQAAGQGDVAEKNRQLLELYRSSLPYREPPASERDKRKD